MTERPKLKIVIPPQVLEQMEQELSQGEIQEILSNLQAHIEAGTLFEQSKEFDIKRMKQENPEEYAMLMEAMARDGFDDSDNFDDWIDHLIDHERPTLN